MSSLHKCQMQHQLWHETNLFSSLLIASKGIKKENLDGYELKYKAI